MPRFDPLAIFVLILSLVLIQQYWPRNDRCENIWQGLEKFGVAAENHLAYKSIPDLRDWRSQRTNTIKTLNELRQKLDNVCFYANCIKAAGSGMGIMCALSSLFARIILPLPVMTVGGFMCPSAFFTKEVSSMMESILSTKYLNELQAVLIKDKETSRSLDEWLKFTPNLEEEVEKIFGFDLKSENSMYFTLLSEFSRLFDIYENFKDAYDIMKRGKYSEFLDKDITIYNLCLKFSKYLENFPNVSGKIELSLSILDVLNSTSEYTRNLNNVHQNFIVEKMVITTSLLQDMLNIKIPPPLKAYVSILLNVLDLAIEVTSFRDATKIIMDGKCPYSDSLKHIIEMLELELTIIESSFFK